jgi:hypothetical protein
LFLQPTILYSKAKQTVDSEAVDGGTMTLKVHYDSEFDVLYLAREGQEEQVVEVSPGLNLELDAAGDLIGVEIL